MRFRTILVTIFFKRVPSEKLCCFIYHRSQRRIRITMLRRGVNVSFKAESTQNTPQSRSGNTHLILHSSH